MKFIYRIILIQILAALLFPAALSAQQGKLDDYLTVPDSLLQIKKPYGLVYRPGLGLIAESEIPEDWTLNTDELFRRFATLPPAETYMDMNYFFDNYAMHLEPEQRRSYVKPMRRIAREYKSERLADEARFLDAFSGHGNDFAEIVEPYWQTALQFEKEGKHLLALRLKLDLFNKARGDHSGDYYYRSFLMAEELLRDVEGVTEEEFPRKRSVYSEVGHLYYHFRDYDNAVPLLEKALTDKTLYYFDTANLRARNTLAVYYHTIGNLEKAAYYYRSMLESPDENFYRPMFSAIALTGLGRIAADRGDFKGALRLLSAALPVPTYANDQNYMVGIMASMGNYYLELGETDKARDMIDSMRLYIHDSNVWISPHRNRELYSLLSKYYIYKGDIPHWEMYADSTAVAEENYEKEFSDQVILKARQEIYEAQKKIRDDKIRASRNYIISLAVILALVAAIAVITVLNSRRLRKKNRSLFERLKDQDMLAKENNRLRTLLKERPAGTENGNGNGSNGNNGKEKNGDDLFFRLSALMEDPKVYGDTKLTRKSLADKLFTNESYLREIIIERTGLTVTEYLTGIRLNRARGLLLSAEPKYTPQEIAHECGLGSVSTFYRLFKNYYGMTPEQFRNSAVEK